MQPRMRNEVSTGTISSLKQEISRVTSAYTDKHSGFFVGFMGRDVREQLKILGDEIQGIIDTKKFTPFEQFSKILNKLHSVYKNLKSIEGKGADENQLIQAIQQVLTEQLHMQHESDWGLSKAPRYLDISNVDEHIDYSLRMLGNACTFSSTEHQIFSEAWKDAVGKPDDNLIWMYLVDNFYEYFDKEYINRLIAEVKTLLGLHSRSQLVNVDDKIFGLQADTFNTCDVIMVSSIPTQDNLKDLPIRPSVQYAYVRCADKLYFVNKAKNEIRELIIDHEQLVEFDTKINPGTETRGLSDTELTEIALITGHSFFKKVGEFDRVVKYADEELKKLEKEHRCVILTIPPEVRRPVEGLLSRTGHEVELAQKLIANVVDKELFEEEIENALFKCQELTEIKITKENRDKLKLDTYQRNIILAVCEKIALKMRILSLRQTLRHIELFSEKNEYKLELVREIKAKNGLFSRSLDMQVHNIAMQFDAFSLDHLVTLCSNYMRYFAGKSPDNANRYVLTEKQNDLIKNFFLPMVEFVVNPVAYILDKREHYLTVREMISETTEKKDSRVTKEKRTSKEEDETRNEKRTDLDYAIDRFKRNVELMCEAFEKEDEAKRTIEKENERLKLERLKQEKLEQEKQGQVRLEQISAEHEKQKHHHEEDGVAPPLLVRRSTIDVSSEQVAPVVSVSSHSVLSQSQQAYVSVLRGSSSVPVAMEHEVARNSELLASAQSAAKLLGEVNSALAKPQNFPKLVQAYDAIARYESLQKALAAAGKYYLFKGDGKTHGDDGKEATLKFIYNLLCLNDYSHANVQNEALKFIKGEGVYGTWYGGSSSYHRHSRIAFLLDSGLFDDRREDIAAIPPVRTMAFFSHAQPFANLPKDERKDLTAKTKSLQRK